MDYLEHRNEILEARQKGFDAGLRLGRMKQFFAPLAATGGVGLCSVATGGTTAARSPGRVSSTEDGQEPVPPSPEIHSEYSVNSVEISESDARRLATAIDNCRPSDVIAVIQRQPWFAEVRRGVRATRHLKCSDYIALGSACVSRATSGVSPLRRETKNDFGGDAETSVRDERATLL